MNNVEKTIYDLLKSGLDADTLTKALNDAQKQIDKEAKEKAEAEKKAKEAAAREERLRLRKQKEVDEARAKVSAAILDYFIALGVVEADVPDKEKKEILKLMDDSIKKEIDNKDYRAYKKTVDDLYRLLFY